MKTAASGTPEPEMAERNLARLISEAGEVAFAPYAAEIARLFSVSQFLANFSISNPEELNLALGNSDAAISREATVEDASRIFTQSGTDAGRVMANLRYFKKRHLLRLTLRDVLGKTDVQGSMDELTVLAEVICDIALSQAVGIVRERFGELSGKSGGLCLIGLGKLGGAELNYSSDVDLLAVYGDTEERTGGVISPSGVRMGRIEAHVYYVKVMELFVKLLNASTEDGLAYRVDLRLRPQGQKGEIALPLSSCAEYYRSWGRTWERMALIRARPVAGDMAVGAGFMSAIEPFVWHRAVDYAEIEEIRAMKKKIDSTFSRDDIKRGYGGIREAEFFVHTFQLIWGGDNPALRTNRLVNAIEALRRAGLIPGDDLIRLWENYLYLRRLEHFLQMKDDLQTHSLPASIEDTASLARKMGYPGAREFISDLRVRRMQIKSMYNSLLGTAEDIHSEAMTLLEGDLSGEELKGYLSFRGVRDVRSGLSDLTHIRGLTGELKTSRERSLMREVVPGLIEDALRAESPDRALTSLERFLSSFGMKEAYLSGLVERKEVRRGVMKMFSLSSYLTRAFLSTHAHLDLLIEENVIKKTLRSLEEDLRRHAGLEGLAGYKVFEEIRLGMLFLSGVLGVHYVTRGLSHLAEAVIRACIKETAGFTVVAMGKLGGREITYGSDLDLIFVSESDEGAKRAEALIRALTSHEFGSPLYNVDMRLRPDGSKGVLVNDVEGYRDYYMRHAHGWELQALLKARPVGGDCAIGRAFSAMAKEAVIARAGEIGRRDIEEMRAKILSEISVESEIAVDVKRGPGGMEDVEFHAQWLALKEAGRNNPSAKGIFVQGIVPLLRRFVRLGAISPKDCRSLLEAYEYLRKLEAFLRLNEESSLVRGTATASLSAIFMGHRDEAELLARIDSLRGKIRALTGL